MFGRRRQEMTGVVQLFSFRRGYGFLTDETGQRRVFRIRDVERGVTPRRRDRVVFRPRSGDRGPEAVDLRIQTATEEETDERLECAGCGEVVVPRIRRPRGRARRAVCPACGKLLGEYVFTQRNVALIVVVFLWIFLILGIMIQSGGAATGT